MFPWSGTKHSDSVLHLSTCLIERVTHFRTSTAARVAYYEQLQFISDSVRDIEPAGLEEDIGDCLQEEHSIQLEIFRLLAKQ